MYYSSILPRIVDRVGLTFQDGKCFLDGTLFSGISLQFTDHVLAASEIFEAGGFVGSADFFLLGNGCRRVHKDHFSEVDGGKVEGGQFEDGEFALLYDQANFGNDFTGVVYEFFEFSCKSESYVSAGVTNCRRTFQPNGNLRRVEVIDGHSWADIHWGARDSVKSCGILTDYGSGTICYSRDGWIDSVSIRGDLLSSLQRQLHQLTSVWNGEVFEMCARQFSVLDPERTDQRLAFRGDGVTDEFVASALTKWDLEFTEFISIYSTSISDDIPLALSRSIFPCDIVITLSCNTFLSDEIHDAIRKGDLSNDRVRITFGK